MTRRKRRNFPSTTTENGDGKPSAQWEIMVLVTEDGHEVLAW